MKEQMKIYFLSFLIFVSSNYVFSQTSKDNLAEIERFCCYDWLPEFNDTIVIVYDESKVNRRKPYCVITKKKGSEYDLYCWTGKIALEQPATWYDKLKMKFKDEYVNVKFGKKKAKYKITETHEGDKLLIISK